MEPGTVYLIRGNDALGRQAIDIALELQPEVDPSYSKPDVGLFLRAKDGQVKQFLFRKQRFPVAESLKLWLDDVDGEVVCMLCRAHDIAMLCRYCSRPLCGACWSTFDKKSTMFCPKCDNPMCLVTGKKAT
jgi:hypothetical protein